MISQTVQNNINNSSRLSLAGWWLLRFLKPCWAILCGSHTMQFTMEKERDNKLPFHDALVARSGQGFGSPVYQKPALIG